MKTKLEDLQGKLTVNGQFVIESFVTGEGLGGLQEVAWKLPQGYFFCGEDLYDLPITEATKEWQDWKSATEQAAIVLTHFAAQQEMGEDYGD